MTNINLVERFLSETEKGSSHTSTNQRGDLKKFFKVSFGKELKDVTIDDIENINPDLVRNYFSEEFEGLKNTTKNRHLSTLKEFLREAKAAEDSNGVPLLKRSIAFIERIKSFNDDSEPSEYMPIEVIKQFLSESKKEKHKSAEKNRMIYLAADQGLRLSELLNLTWGNFTKMDDGVLIRGYGKRNHKYTKKISYKVYEYILELKTSESKPDDKVFSGLDSSSMSRMMNRIKKNLGYEDIDYTFHSLRDFAITFGYRLTGDILEAQRIAEHEDLNTTRRYLKSLDYGVMGAFSLQNHDEEAYKKLSHEDLLKTIELIGSDFIHILNIRSKEV